MGNSMLFKGLSVILLYYFILFLFFWPHHVACGILVPRPGIEPGPSSVKAQNPNHWTTREFPSFKKIIIFFLR